MRLIKSGKKSPSNMLNKKILRFILMMKATIIVGEMAEISSVNDKRIRMCCILKSK